MLNLQQVAESVNDPGNGLLQQLKGSETSKSKWADLYFYLIGDPMQQKDNKVRTYIKKQLTIKEKTRLKNRYRQNRSVVLEPKTTRSKKQVTFKDSYEAPPPGTLESSRNHVLPEPLDLVRNKSKELLKLRSRF